MQDYLSVYLSICQSVTLSVSQVRVYDPSCQRRPVLEAEFGEVPLTALSVPPGENSVVVGNTHGQLATLDLRKGVCV